MSILKTLTDLGMENNKGYDGSSSHGIAGTSGDGTSSSSSNVSNVHEYSSINDELRKPEKFDYSLEKAMMHVFSLLFFWGLPFFLLPMLKPYLKLTDHDGNTIFSSALIFSVIITVCFLTPIFIMLFSGDKKKDTNVYKIDDEESFKKKMKQHEQFIKDQQSKYKI